MRTLSAQALREVVTQKAAADSAFAAELRQHADQAIESRFGKQPFTVRAIYEQAGELSLLVPQKTVALEQVINRSVADLGTRQPTSGEVNALVIQRAWNDAAFATLLAKDPRQALDLVLKPFNTSVPAGKQVKAYFEGANECVIVFPATGSTHELTDEELEAVAGGEEIVTATAVIVSAVVTETICS